MILSKDRPISVTESTESELQILSEARKIIQAEGQAVLGLEAKLDQGFSQAIQMILATPGRLVVTGMGKSGIVGQKISATFASTGTPSLFIHAAEAVHGDLGRLKKEDLLLVLSYSGESEEIVRLIRPIKNLGVYLVALTGEVKSTLAMHADVIIAIGDIAEACPMGLVPTASTTAMMVIGDALALCLFKARGLNRFDYARFHPGGQLGRKLMNVSELMRQGEENPVIPQKASLLEVITVMTKTKGRPGAASIVDADGKLVGFFTDGDLRRLLSNGQFGIEQPISDLMHCQPKSIHRDKLVVEAERILREHQIDQVPVLDDEQKPIGLLDVQDILGSRML